MGRIWKVSAVRSRMMLRKMSQLCPSPHSPIPDFKSFQFPEKLPSQCHSSFDKDPVKPKEESAPEKSLVLGPTPDVCSRSATKSTGRSTTSNSCPTCNSGLINLALLMGLVTLLKIILGFCANVNADVPAIATVIPTNFQLPLFFLVFPVIVLLLTYRVELLISQNKISWDNALPCHLATLAMVLILPAVGLRRQLHLDGLIFNLLICFSYIIMAMKLVSYIQVNKKCREELVNDNTTKQVVYPANLTLGSITYFLLSPTLTYQPNVSRTSTIQLNVVFLRALECCVLQLGVRSAIMAIPNVIVGLLEAIKSEDMVVVVERFLTLSLVFNIVFMSTFYLLFVSFLQLTSELLQVQERKFFHSWWNASTMEEFWRWWNLPVHRWCVKHIYLPFVKNGWSKRHAMLAVFLTSALLHEYLISCPLQITGHFAFIGFLGQLPLCKISEVAMSRCGGRVGNLLVWGILIFGNAVGVVVYYKEVVGAK